MPAMLALAAAVGIGAGCTKEEASFTGIWKVDCADYWGVQVRPAGTRRYAVTFCGLSGCMEPGTWMPDTSIANDPLYEVESATRLRIKRKDTGHFTYTRCSTDPTWKVRSPR